MFEPIPQTPRYRLVADALIARIEDGSLQVGKKLPPDRVLVDQLGVSRATLREALIALEVMGYLETRFGSGAYVADRQPGKRDAAPAPRTAKAKDTAAEAATQAAPVPAFSNGPFETLEARRLIEGELAALAAGQIMPPELDRLWDAVNRMETAAGWDAEADEIFHATLAKAAGNSVLAELAADFWRSRKNDPLWSVIDRAVEDTNNRPALVAEHQAIIEALTEGDPDAARAAMHRHLDSFAETLLNELEAPADGSPETVPHSRLKTAIIDTQ